MAKRSSIEKQKRKQRMVKRYWERRQALKAKAMDMNLDEEERYSARIALDKLPRNSSPVRLNSRCEYTGRVRGYLRKYKMSRLCFREFASAGMIPGVYKASW